MQRWVSPMEQMTAVTFYGRCIALVMLVIWSRFLFGYDYRDGEIGGSSTMHCIRN